LDQDERKKMSPTKSQVITIFSNSSWYCFTKCKVMQ